MPTTPNPREVTMLAEVSARLGRIAELITYGRDQPADVTESDPYLKVHPGTAPLTVREADLMRELHRLEGIVRVAADSIRFHTEEHRNA